MMKSIEPSTTVKNANHSTLSIPRGHREIPFNYTSADDWQVVSFLLGTDIALILEELRVRRVTGRSARLLMRFFGEILIYRRNPYLFQELVTSASRRKRMFDNAEKHLSIIEQNIGDEARVHKVLVASRQLLNDFRSDVERAPSLRRRMKKELGAVAGVNNVLVDPFTLVSHATDATDWRLHLPVAVVMPDKEEQIAPLLTAIAKMGLKAVPRGGGTGLTGGAVPLRSDCVVINTEKLDRIRGMRDMTFKLSDGQTAVAQVLELEVGVITDKAHQYASSRGLVFATDPTSAWASTIGGNISENAGGKCAVRWGTCIDNLISWRMAMPGGQRWEVRRIDHQLRKILPEDNVTFEVLDQGGESIKIIVLKGSEIRKKGLWKDITNKALGGVPGLQKEGTDGIITSAEFILYPKFEATRTICLEFFGQDMEEASHVIVELSKAFPFPDQGEETLIALEHFDDEYVRAIAYQVKSSRFKTPKAVLLIDVAGHSPEQTQRGIDKIRAILDQHPNSELFEAHDAAEAERYWADRKKFGAIARRTNAFKLNEDVVIPLETLAEFARFIDEVNIEEERYAQLKFLDRAAALFREPPLEDNADSFATRADVALELYAVAKSSLPMADEKTLRSLTIIKGFKKEVAELARGFPKITAAVNLAHQQARDRRIVLATHMHAGDGNVHVNLPVLSNDMDMLERSGEVIDQVMAKVVELGGVVSGEHGIGVTKLKYLEKERIAELSAYRSEVDPTGLMNPGKLEDFAALEHIFTPSFNLLGLEAHILRHGQLEELANKIAHCVRCGKCKPDCGVFHPAGSLFYHPRNKNLAIGAIIEALLFDAQREYSTKFELLQWLEDVSDHCTTCHKCAKPCPVDIDSADVSVLERQILADWGYKHTPAATKMTLRYLSSGSPMFNKVFRFGVLRAGLAGQQLGTLLASPLQPKKGHSKHYPLQLLHSPMPSVHANTLRDLLPDCKDDQVLVFEPEQEAERTVFYFPGCGSERMVSDISMAAIHVLMGLKTRVILPPPFLCCGFPAYANGQTELHSQNGLRVTILLNQIRDMFTHLEFDGCVVTCGTCREGLNEMEAAKLFGGRLVDITRYALEQGLHLDGTGSESYLYHAPCHDSLEGKALDVLGKLGGFGSVKTVPNCCSEAGTLSLSRPDISAAMLHRKRDSLAEAMPEKGRATILTNCPSCIQGLGRNKGMGVDPQHLAVALAEKLSGKSWLKLFKAQAGKARAFNF
jgi:FAD/FMN-containing dehydrogenase/heterodisulfide reductase subunit C